MADDYKHGNEYVAAISAMLQSLRLGEPVDTSNGAAASAANCLHESASSDTVLNKLLDFGVADCTRKAAQVEQLLHENDVVLDSLALHVSENHVLDKDINAQLNTLQTSVAKVSARVASIAAPELQRLAATAYDTTKDGIFTWRISQLSERLQKENIQSDTFYTAPDGYKLRLLLSFEQCQTPGNGKSTSTSTSEEGSYLSLYVKLCCGDYDAVNKWPLECNVQLTCFDQRVSQHQQLETNKEPCHCHCHSHVVKSFPLRTLRNSTALTGVSKFLFLPSRCGRFSQPAENEPAYIKDDVLFLRAVIDPVD